jgi:hypothetical protein
MKNRTAEEDVNDIVNMVLEQKKPDHEIQTDNLQEDNSQKELKKTIDELSQKVEKIENRIKTIMNLETSDADYNDSFVQNGNQEKTGKLLLSVLDDLEHMADEMFKMKKYSISAKLDEISDRLYYYNKGLVDE